MEPFRDQGYLGWHVASTQLVAFSWPETSVVLYSSPPIKISACGTSPGSESHSWKDRTLTLLQVWLESLRTKSSWGVVAMTMLLLG